MKIKSSDLEKIIDKLLSDFADFSFIDRKYLNDLLMKFQSKTFTFEGITVNVNCEENDNVYYYLLFQAKFLLNQVLCKKAKDDEEILLQLMITYNSKIEPYMKKLKIDTNSPLYDQYLEEAIDSYDGSKDLELYLINYLKNIFNGKYKPEKSNRVLVHKGNGHSINQVEDNKVSNITSLEKTSNSETFIAIGETDSKPKKASKSNKNKQRVVKTEEVTIEKDRNKEKNKYIFLFNFLKLNDSLSKSDNPEYNLYISLRFNKYYSLKEIEETAKISKVSLYEYEKYTVERIKEELNQKLDSEINLILN